MRALQICLIFLDVLMIACLRNPKYIEYLEKKTLVPSQDEIRSVLKDGLKKNFAEVYVEIVDNPDLTQDPFYLASSGISGDPLIIEYGNDDFIVPLVDKSKVYDLIPTVREIDSYGHKSFFACGSGAGPFEWLGENSEGVYNLKVFENGTIINEGHVTRTTTEGVEVLKMPENETRAALLGNIFLTEGKSGKILKVVAKNRTGSENFISAMQKALAEKYPGDQVVGLGGAFVMKTGFAYVHVMSDFSEKPIDTTEELNEWLTWHEIPGPIIALGDFVSQETDFELRLQHFHCFSKHNYGGHYHYDTTPEIVEYEGYFNVAERIVLIDKNTALRKLSNGLIILISSFIIKVLK